MTHPGITPPRRCTHFPSVTERGGIILPKADFDQRNQTISTEGRKGFFEERTHAVRAQHACSPQDWTLRQERKLRP